MKITKNNIGEYLLSEMLTIHNLTIEQVREIPDWYSKYEWTYQDSRDFIKRYSPIVKKALRCNNKVLEKEWAWFMLQYGFKYKSQS